MDLATPFFRHLARPREAEKMEREKLMENIVGPFSMMGGKVMW